MTLPARKTGDLPDQDSGADALEEIPFAIVAQDLPVNEPSEIEFKKGRKLTFSRKEHVQTDKYFPTDKKKRGYSYKKAQPAAELEREHSRLVSKGLSLPHPFKVYMGALITVVFLVSAFLSLFVPLYLFVLGEVDVPSIIIPSVAILSGILYLLLSMQCRCRVCRQPFYSLKNFQRNRKAHRIFPFGYAFTTALHMIFLRWFRCQACGTAQKLAKGTKD